MPLSQSWSSVRLGIKKRLYWWEINQHTTLRKECESCLGFFATADCWYLLFFFYGRHGQLSIMCMRSFSIVHLSENDCACRLVVSVQYLVLFSSFGRCMWLLLNHAQVGGWQWVWSSMNKEDNGISMVFKFVAVLNPGHCRIGAKHLTVCRVEVIPWLPCTCEG